MSNANLAALNALAGAAAASKAPETPAAAGQIDLSALFGAPSAAAPAKEERPQAEFYINVGVWIPDATVEAGKRFISLPFGLALDTMNEADSKGTRSPEMANAIAERNVLLKAIRENVANSNMEPGAQVEAQLSCVIQRVRAAGKVDPNAVKTLESQLGSFAFVAQPVVSMVGA